MDEKVIRFSFIVPVYNVEQYLKECLDSLINQKYNGKYEIVVVNDGSKDNSLQIINEYKKNNSELIKVTNQTNKGLGGARNTGIKEANGEWVIFIDSDDFVDVNLLNIVDAELSQIKSNKDIILFNYYRLKNDGSLELGMSFDSDFVSKMEEKERIFRAPVTAWGKIINKKIFLDNDLWYPEHRYFEDIAIFPQLCECIDHIGILNVPLYYYRQRDYSITNDSNVEKIYDIVSDIEDVYLFFLKRNEISRLYNEIEYFAIIHILLEAYINIIFINRKSEYLDKILNFMYRKFPDFKKNIYLKNLSLKNKVFLNLIVKGRTEKIYKFLTIKEGLKKKYKNSTILVKLYKKMALNK